MKLLMKSWRIFAIAILFLSLAFALSLLRPLLRAARKGETRDRIVSSHLRIICRVMGLRIHLKGDLFPKTNFLLLANHVSYLDIIILGSLAPMSFMAKEEIKAWPVIGFLAKRGRAVFVGRDSVSARVKALHQAKGLLQNESLCIFPEGTTSAAHSPSAERWYRGNIALAKSHPLVLAGIHYQDQSRLAWIDDQELVPHLWDVLGMKRINVSIETKVFPSSRETSLKEMSQLAHQLICRLTESAHDRSKETECMKQRREHSKLQLLDSLSQIR
ncbi:MAG: 1-acyl-sn-glycerol-3-phosphate acyltransferase [Proteobacteria bacterium]|nr:MAG: 1-acyl-sn-glycerol-3-phosphate acyltransferase [Pseudomonadota bacterium]